MKKLLICLLTLLLLAGCTPGAKDDGADSTGRYALLPKGECSSLVVNWLYPDDAFDADFNSVKLDLSNIEKYVDPDADTTGGGANLNNLMGSLGFQGRSFLKAEPIGIDDAGAKQVAKKKPYIYLYIEGKDGRSFKVRLKYDNTIHD